MKYGAIILLFVGLFLTSQSALAESVSGTYRCWSFNVGGRGGKCTSPPIVLYPDGRYSMSSEQGTYSVAGDQIKLSQSQKRGPGKLLENGNQIQFQYQYNGLDQTVTYLRQGDAPSAPDTPKKEAGGGGISTLDLTISCSGSGSSVDWINTASLNCGDGNRYDALAVAKDKVTLSAYFRQVPPGKSCSVTVSSGFDSKTVGNVQTTGSVKKTIQGQCAW